VPNKDGTRTASPRGPSGYDVGESLGGSVYRARAIGTHREVAVKSLRHLDPRTIPRFQKRFEHAAKASHPNLVSLYELDVTGHTPFYAMELVEGVDILTAVTHPGIPAKSRQVRANLDRLRPVMRQLADGLGALHDSGVRHDNLKPSNVLVTPQGRVVVTDFGLTEHAAQGNTLDNIANHGLYMSPEQTGGGKLTPASDWYAFGVILYESLTGRMPFVDGKSAVSTDPEPPSRLVDGTPPELDRLCLRLLERDPARRATRDDVMEVFDEPDTQTESLHTNAPSIDLEPRPSAAIAKKTVEFGGTERFQILRTLGRGGMGVVYEAFDRERNMQVALKTLLRLDPGTIYRFKQEFRALVDVAHPNLVGLYELVSTRGQWFFTMELLAGADFVSYVRGRNDPSESSRSPSPFGHGSVEPDQPSNVETPHIDDEVSEEPTAVLTSQKGKLPRAPAKSSQPIIYPIDWGRLRDALLQLAHGVHALHASGHMHRDIKPSNVIVTREGRVVLLDFGVIAELGATRHRGQRELVGTPMYMAPEQSRGKIMKASDWYSVGVMLYRVLTGSCPFVGSIEQVLFAKNEQDPVPPTAVRTDLPDDLVSLCMDLLQRDPAKRPTGDQVLNRLGATRVSRSLAVNITGRRRASSNIDRALAGREHHLGELREAFQSATQGTGQTVFVHGSSGMGKSVLIDHFLREVAATPKAIVLAGRCYEREQVPYKGVDAAVDALSRYLLSLPEDEAAALAPRDLVPLARVFPVLESVKMFARAERSAAAPEPQELRRRAFAALRQLLGAIAQRGPLVVFIDDAQWGDRDSAPLLAQLMRPPNVPPLLLLLSYRTDDAPRSPLLSSLLASDGLLVPGATTRELTVGPLSHEEARGLAFELLDNTSTDAAATIARESRGHPYFIQELARHVKDEGLTEGEALSLDAVIANRVQRLPEPARRLMEIVAVAGQPMSQALIGRATVVDNQERVTLINQLRVAELIRTSGVGDSDLAECYHDRIRELLVGALPPERLVDSHRRIAFAMLDGGEADPEALAIHFHGAGDVKRAFAYATKAADRAAAALAFDRAASLYRLALELEIDAEVRRSLNEKLGDALRNGGRGAEAAAAYQAAADGAPIEQRLVRQRLAAEQLMYSGHLDEGLRIIEDVLAQVNLRLAKTARGSLMTLLWRRFRLRLRGLSYKPRPLAEIPRELLQLIDTCYGVGTSLSLVDPVRANAFQALNLRLSLDSGDLYRVSRSLSIEAGFVSSMGIKMVPRVEQLLAKARSIATEINNPHAIGLSFVVSGIAAYETGNLRAACQFCEAAEEVLGTQCSGVAWELACARLFGSWSRYRLGDIAFLIERVPQFEREASERGDLYGMLAMATGCPRIAMTLVTDQPAQQRKIAEDAIARWPGVYYQIQHYWADYAIMHIDLYAGDPEPAWERIRRIWPMLQRVMLLRVEEVQVYMNEIRARIALAMAARSKNNKPYIAEVERVARLLASKRVPWCPAMANLLRAQLASLAGNRQRELELLTAAQTTFEESQIVPYAMVSRLRRGALLGGREGEAHVVAAQSWAHTEHVANLDGFTRMLAPVFATRPRDLLT
jgi:serine/threonine protein kinase